MAKTQKELRNAENQLVVFQLAGQTYGINIASVYEIIRMEVITKVPLSPDFVEGVINLRGKIIPVIDLCKMFNLPINERTSSTRIIVVDISGNTVGMIVDAVSEVLRIPLDSIEPPPPMVNGIDSAYLRGIAIMNERLVILLNLEKVLHEHEWNKLQELELEKA